ncbi:hypothetical protein [Flavobacterium aquatile]|uniref:Uncharacterized protein n=1 Tax=Flavobacterium aquatile LMG 4008 = ATCC 11947 TaxID=1453498 RepID=A0A095SXL5_9FLAO|nr:hypothetical protein [Flavobacterium aquatile]KGD69446.1 hypothetical protein LG45_01365 [Flavobacterium aquatile LMG 4008 = ATCC 11947]OXA66098.1 hypothetical protein B0A61_12555 [Flavobacterium aquatile LMG 4008 = ATCC 11947]GEC77581.1 hypothetical protein FAQ01_04510 [Flavobacterium aquatile]
MQFLEITLDVLLENPNINHALIGEDWYFNHSDINKAYGNNFKYLPVKLLSIEIENKKKLVKYISYSEIKEHIEFSKTRKSFQSNIDKALGL